MHDETSKTWEAKPAGDVVTISIPKQGWPAADLAPAGALPASSIPATCGRIVHVFSKHWQGPRPGVVMRPLDDNTAAVNVMLNGAEDAGILAEFRARPEGNTIAVTIYDPLTNEQRDIVANDTPWAWAEWMPFQKGQAQLTAQAQSRVPGLIDSIQKILRLLASNENDDTRVAIEPLIEKLAE
jgi:hypothetical protein